MRRRLGLATLLSAAAAAAALQLWATRDARATGAPRLVLFLSVDQMRFDYLTRFSPLFHAGFRTLLDHGAVFTNAHYAHANTETGPGHSVLLSGRSP